MDVLTKEEELTEEEEDKLLSKMHLQELIEKEVAISYDGTNLLVRFPKEIAEFLGVNPDNRFENSLKFIVKEKDGEITKSFDIVEKDAKTKKD